ncbi:leucine-rich protein [Roridomyces roridus]|uniref:Leucine-rich protein n=1 Tax=Roridomyces roridus TaxID=1738132 RepID=A0AAD7CFE1_9AGAR|nr:leucine-rich protein [Roridomyces roridus]
MTDNSGDAYIRRLASFVRTNEKSLAAAGAPKSRSRSGQRPEASGSSLYNPWSWFTDQSAPAAPLVLSIDTHHLFYVLMRLEAQGIDVGTLDVRIDSPSRPMSYITDTLSLASFRSTLSAVSGLSLGVGWWGRPEPPSLEAELKYLFSSFTKLPALSIAAPTNKLIAELADEPPNENALPLDAFRNLQSLECVDIDPRALLGWDRLAESLRSLRIKRSGLEDVSDVFVGAVLDDQARRAGSVSRQRRRRIPRGSAPVYGTRLPDSVPEEPENGSETPTELSPLKWAFLKHLSLSDNSLTFFPSVPYLTSLTHLDLSSNLLVSVPPNISSLYNLVSLNLSDNMIDSVLAIYQHLGQVLYLNLSRNRLESLCGLERLPALERVDLRHNLVDESAEVGRLAALPNISQVWIEGNPFTEIEEGYRVVCFDYFRKEGKTVSLDGSQPGFYEKRNLTTAPSPQMTSTRPLSAAYSPPVVAVGHPHAHAHGTTSPLASGQTSPSPPTTSPNLGPVSAVGVSGKARRKNKRIVNLDAGESDGGSSHTRNRSDGSGRAAAQPKLLEEESVIAPLKTINSAGLVPRRSRHSRYQSEIVQPTSPTDEERTPSLTVAPSASLRLNRNSATLSGRGSARRARVTASVYEPVLDGQGDEATEDSVDTYRRQIEALKKDMGDGWLKVFRQNS